MVLHTFGQNGERPGDGHPVFQKDIRDHVCLLFGAGYFFSVALFFIVVTGKTDIPQWCCIFNALPIFLVLTPFHIAGAGNIAGAVMFLGLFL